MLDTILRCAVPSSAQRGRARVGEATLIDYNNAAHRADALIVGTTLAADSSLHRHGSSVGIANLTSDFEEESNDESSPCYCFLSVACVVARLH